MSKHFPSQIDAIMRLKRTDWKFNQICTEFEEIATEKDRVETVVAALQSSSSQIQELIDLGKTLDGLRVEIQQILTDQQPNRKEHQQ